MVGLVVIKQKCLENYFPDTKNQRDVRSAFIRLFGTCISLPLKRIHYKIKGEVFWLGVILLIFLLSFHQWIIDHSSPLQQQGLPQTYTAFSFPLDLFSFFLSPERPVPRISITHWLQISRTFWLFYNSFSGAGRNPDQYLFLFMKGRCQNRHMFFPQGMDDRVGRKFFHLPFGFHEVSPRIKNIFLIFSAFLRT